MGGDSMDDIDRQILRLLEKDARMTVKEISARVSLTSPAVSERIRRMEKGGVIAGYTVVPGKALTKAHVDALISVTVPQANRAAFLTLTQTLANVAQCYHETGAYSYLVKVSCSDMVALDEIINRFQSLGQTSTQIILSTPVDRYAIW